ncbi:uncharacterized protein LOC108834473 [Raphanus sativus]|uniref:Uncharacterized protein LOC108834473 n=1 Tax=Raphanus sativus TaxID=3726 RepID=A0A6J0LSU3_RAPSA|nr:uncharacterized protein LOC108834473 [Raphanus sativus]
MDTNPSHAEHPNFPERMFAIGEEPVGIRVTPYHKPSVISKIFNALEEDEIRFIRDSSFGKLIEIAEKPSFSGRFGRFLFSRQLKVLKKREVWFLFAGKPIRLSIREFALVTGLNYRNYPPHCKKRSKKFLTEKPYWLDLFGTMTEVPASHVVTMLKKKTVTDLVIRIKYALLALLAAVILPMSHNPRISHAFTEKIKDLDQFLAYPWGRASFDMLIGSIKERNEVTLSQNTIAFKGFVLAVQLVLIEVVPSLMGVVRDGGSSGSEADSADDEEICVDDDEGMNSINTSHVPDIDSACKAHVISIISPGVEIPNLESEISVSDDEVDEKVDNLVSAVEACFPFANSHFKGGVTVADVNRMRQEGKKDNLNRKTSRPNQNQTPPGGFDAEHVAKIVKNSVSEDLSKMAQHIKDIAVSMGNSQNLFQKNMQDMFQNFQKEIEEKISTLSRRPIIGEAVHTDHVNTSTANIHAGGGTSFDAAGIIENAMRFANHQSTQAGNPSSEDIGCAGGVHVDGKIGDPITEEEENEGEASPEESVRNADIPAELCEDQEDHICEDVRTGDEAQGGSAVAREAPAQSVLTHPPNPTVTEADELNRSLVSPSVVIPANVNKVATGTGLSFPDPSFSIGLTQLNEPDVDDADPAVDPGMEEEPLQDIDNHCDKRILTRSWESYVNGICITGIDYAAKLAMLSEKLASPFVIDVGSLSLESNKLLAIVERTSHLPAKVLDVLISHTRSVFHANPEHLQDKNSVFLDAKFVSQLAKSFAKFSKSQKKDNVRFPAALCSLVARECPISEATRFYFPFNFDKQHWVGVYVDCSLSQVILLDCNTGIKTDASIAKDLRPITQMFPYILRQAGKQLSAKEMKPLTVDRSRGVPQNNNMVESGITSILLIQAHAVGGIDVCQCITPEVVATEAERAAVMIYEENVEVL